MKEDEQMNLPNKLTMLRILLVPVFMVLAGVTQYGTASYTTGAWYLAAGIVFAAASFTDYLDGYLARRWNLVTDFGKFADPLADKLLTTVAFLYMMRDGVCSIWVVAVILAREFAVAGVRMVAAAGSKVIAANMWGKVKTALQMLTICFYYFGYAAEAAFSAHPERSVFATQVISYVLCWVVAAVTLISGVKYLWDNRHFINTAK